MEGEDYFGTLKLEDSSGAEASAYGAQGDIPIRGLWTLRYRSRWSDSDNLSDLGSYASVDVGAAELNPYSFHVRASGRAELARSSGRNSFDGSLQTFSNDANSLLYDAYLDAHDIHALDIARVGRQTDFQVPVVAIYDGLHVESREHGDSKIRIGGYGGLAVRQYDDAGDEALYGLYLESLPWTAARLRLDWMHVDDQVLIGDVGDDLVQVSLWQTLLTKLRLEGSYSRLESEDRDVRLRATWNESEQDLILQASYYELIQPQSFQANELDPFSYVAGVLFPYRQAALLASKGLGEHLAVQAGLELRRVKNAGDIGTYNRDADHYYLTANLLELGHKETTVSITGDFWQDSSREILTWGADLTQGFDDENEGRLGTYYSLYKTDLVTGVERADVRTYYLNWEHEASAALTLDVGYEYEDLDFEDFQQLKVRASWRF